MAVKLNKIRGLMAEKRISQRKMADLMGIDKNTVGAILNGDSKLDTERIIKICEILDIKDEKMKTDIFLS